RLSPTAQLIGFAPIYVVHAHATIPVYWGGSGFIFPLLYFYLGIIVPGAGRMVVTNLGRREGIVLALVAVALLCLPGASVVLLQLHEYIGPTIYAVNKWYSSFIGVTVPLAAFYLISWIAYGNDSKIHKFLNSRALRHLGRMSFSIYLLHLPII